MNTKKKVGLIYGGNSFEHEVSKMTAQSIRENIDQSLFDIKEIYIDKSGNFDKTLLKDIEVAFLAIHGPNCEDGKLQKFLQDNGLKYTGSGAKASQINMDKIIMHDYFRKAGLNTVSYFGFNKIFPIKDIKKSVNKLGLPIIVKPNNTGSSIGILRVENIDQLDDALKEAFKYDNRIIIEKAVLNPRELEVAVLGNDKLLTSKPGEIFTHGQVYSYENKYCKPFKTNKVAEELSKTQVNQLKEMAETAYCITGCKGYARIDFFMDQNGQIYINEINTLPGFTKISMFPQLMQALGFSYQDLITEIIQLALKK